MLILQQKKVTLIHDLTSMSKPDFNLGIYLTTDKVAQYILVDDNEREKETTKKTATQKFHPQQNRCEDFQKCQESMNSLSSSPTEEYMSINLVNLSSNTLKYAFSHIGG